MGEVSRVSKKMPSAVSASGAPRRKQFSSTEHLSPEAIAAFTDNELSATAARRARSHLMQCAECFAEVQAQRSTSQRVRRCNDDDLHAPDSLVERLARLCSDNVADRPGADPSAQSHGSMLDKMEVVFRTLRRRG